MKTKDFLREVIMLASSDYEAMGFSPEQSDPFSDFLSKTLPLSHGQIEEIIKLTERDFSEDKLCAERLCTYISTYGIHLEPNSDDDIIKPELAVSILRNRQSPQSLSDRALFTSISGSASSFLRQHYGDVLPHLDHTMLAAHDGPLVEALRAEARATGLSLTAFINSPATLRQQTEEACQAVVALLDQSVKHDPSLAAHLRLLLTTYERATAPGDVQSDPEEKGWTNRVRQERELQNWPTPKLPDRKDEPRTRTGKITKGRQPAAEPLPTLERTQPRWNDLKARGAHTALSFLLTHYGERIRANQLTSPMLREEDLDLYRAFQAFKSRYPKKVDFHLPTKKELVDEELRDRGKGDPDNMPAREYLRLMHAARRRGKAF